MLYALLRFLHPRSRSQSGQRSNLCLGNNSKTTEANLTKLHRKIKDNVKVCRAHNFGSQPKVKVTIGSEVKIVLAITQKLLKQI